MSELNPNIPICYLTAADVLFSQPLHDLSDIRKAKMTTSINQLIRL